MTALITVDSVSKRYGSTQALKNISLEVQPGRIIGLVGPNGAGKTTLLKALTGGIAYEGRIDVLGFDPYRQRPEVMALTGVIHDVAVLPRWMRVSQVLDLMAGVHGSFDRARCEAYLSATTIEMTKKVRQLSKGMITQLHLALVLATQTRLLILDEPTHGLDILFRKRLYSSILEDYFDQEKTVFISTHQVEEVEHILSDVVFIRDGEILLYSSMDDLHKEFLQITTSADQADPVRGLNPLSEHDLFGKKVFILRGQDQAAAAALGEVQTPSIADIFVALMGGVA